LTSCSFDEHELVSTILSVQHQHVFINDTRIQLSLSLHIHLMYLLLTSCDGHDAKSILNAVCRGLRCRTTFSKSLMVSHNPAVMRHLLQWVNPVW